MEACVNGARGETAVGRGVGLPHSQFWTGTSSSQVISAGRVCRSRPDSINVRSEKRISIWPPVCDKFLLRSYCKFQPAPLGNQATKWLPSSPDPPQSKTVKLPVCTCMVSSVAKSANLNIQEFLGEKGFARNSRLELGRFEEGALDSGCGRHRGLSCDVFLKGGGGCRERGWGGIGARDIEMWKGRGGEGSGELIRAALGALCHSFDTSVLARHPCNAVSRLWNPALCGTRRSVESPSSHSSFSPFPHSLWTPCIHVVRRGNCLSCYRIYGFSHKASVGTDSFKKRGFHSLPMCLS